MWDKFSSAKTFELEESANEEQTLAPLELLIFTLSPGQIFSNSILILARSRQSDV